MQRLLQTVLERLTEPGLKATVAAILKSKPRDTATGRMIVGAAWDKYAIARFNGRLLPGCCYLECANMQRASEASLPTLLCGGCRRVRYCSLQCQRAAWVQGGHRGVCSLPYHLRSSTAGSSLDCM